MEKPLISFVVASYNQEAFVQEAVQGALAQTYSPLEIVISDDCSRDRTFEAARAAVTNYRGPHRIKFNRNPTNLGIGGHANRLMEVCEGELVVAGAGDDVSLPERTQVLYEAWEHSHRKATSIFSSYMTISATGQELGLGGFRGDPQDQTLYRPQQGNLYDYLSRKWPVVVGCTHCWSRELFRYFGPLRADLEDLVLSFRTLAIGELLYVHRPLINYRRHGDNVSFFAEWDDTQSFEHREKRLRWTDAKHVMAYDNMLADISTLERKGKLNRDEALRLQEEARRMRDEYAVEVSLMDSGFGKRWSIVGNTLASGRIRLGLRSIPRALPRRVFRQLWMLRNRWRTFVKAPRSVPMGAPQ
jgi:glycosyltransferase involved in cell wall biosynthesis